MKRTTTRLLIAEMVLLALGNGFAQSLSTVQFASAAYSVNENAGSVVLTVQRVGPPDGTAYVEYVTQSDSATDGEDYSGDWQYVLFNGETNLTIRIPILNDMVAEPNETFLITLFNADPHDTSLGLITRALV